ncbi:Co2+/Mg2+ efflux protein ApaG [Tenacibaculum piscium]|uniref:Protein ApaG n=1 Tax=Tenacibaculum piscium TaxID=1458515 RepID=A0A2H1YJB1_9FLAO|nr:Co2+/Mg2+ efflux protein ApaG [Tenacibaculum piscium]MBE7628778.1 Co2+/Mg2+ efflux protein ApaG [Tenacibaculum piscium]MBE7669919.1 Co2+/Mg2+ efflux protein ApaG [Tenacibaculum piscium]MBE7684486.1 Co2+/Mg2+ efflux protein ApaG [Tenacibaculum piscium]MBE7689106.1 Co2+/Mg2+ efflux protein ApaG [Tenacibaculum piscium]MCG8183007.1 Co2+/Mg2+ efflux protein ApaG [Tenacibaculum piscium]
MLQQITKGIKIGVQTNFVNVITYESEEYYHFKYAISIENTSENTVQLLERFWEIFDTLNQIDYVEGEGVIGETPILKPNEVFKYESFCFLRSSIGAMKGSYKMMNLETFEEFLVTIPTFQLGAINSLN